MFIPLSARGSGDTRRFLSLALQSFGLFSCGETLGKLIAVDGFERDGLGDRVDDDCAGRAGQLNIVGVSRRCLAVDKAGVSRQRKGSHSMTG